MRPALNSGAGRYPSENRNRDMKIECLVLRPGGSRIDVPDYDRDGKFVTLHFTGPAGGPHVADVTDPRHAELLAENQHFVVIEDDAERDAREAAAAKARAEAEVAAKAEAAAKAAEEAERQTAEIAREAAEVSEEMAADGVAAVADLPDEGAADDLKAARARYEEIVKKKPFGGWKVDELNRRIAEHQKGA